MTYLGVWEVRHKEWSSTLVEDGHRGVPVCFGVWLSAGAETFEHAWFVEDFVVGGVPEG